MGWPEQVAQVIIVLRMLVCIPDNKTDGTACRLAFEDTAQQFHSVCFLPGCGELALSWSAPVEFLLDEVQIDVYACRHAINHTANGFAMTLAEGRQREDVSERVTHLCWWVRGLMMAMSTATAVAVLVVVVAALVIAAFVITAFAMMMATARTAACQVLDEVLYLFFRGLAVLHHLTGEVQGLACQRMVGIDGHTVFFNLDDLCHEMLVLIVHQGNDCPLVDILVVEMAVDRKDATVDFMHALRLVGAKSILRLQDKVESIAFCQAHHLLFECVECYAKTSDKLKGLLLASLLLQVLLSVSNRVKLVDYRHESVIFLLHIPYYI